MSSIYAREAIADLIQAKKRIAELETSSIAGVWAQARQNHERYSYTGSDEDDLRFLTIGLVGEAGELANFVKKRWRDDADHVEDIRLEIADVCAYAFMLAQKIGMTPADLIGTIDYKQKVFLAKMAAKQSEAVP